MSFSAQEAESMNFQLPEPRVRDFLNILPGLPVDISGSYPLDSLDMIDGVISRERFLRLRVRLADNVLYLWLHWYCSAYFNSGCRICMKRRVKPVGGRHPAVTGTV